MFGYSAPIVATLRCRLLVQVTELARGWWTVVEGVAHKYSVGRSRCAASRPDSSKALTHSGFYRSSAHIPYGSTTYSPSPTPCGSVTDPRYSAYNTSPKRDYNQRARYPTTREGARQQWVQDQWPQCGSEDGSPRYWSCCSAPSRCSVEHPSGV